MQNRQRAVLRRTRDSSAERGSTIETVGRTDGGIPCIRQKGAQSQEGSPRSRVRVLYDGAYIMLLRCSNRLDVRYPLPLTSVVHSHALHSFRIWFQLTMKENLTVLVTVESYKRIN